MDNIRVRAIANTYFSEIIETIDPVPLLNLIAPFLAWTAPHLQVHVNRGLAFKVKLKAEFKRERAEETPDGLEWVPAETNFYMESVAQDIQPGIAGARFPTIDAWFRWIVEDFEHRTANLQQYRYRLNGLVIGQILVAPSVQLRAAAQSGMLDDDDEPDVPAEDDAEEAPKKKGKPVPRVLSDKRATAKVSDRSRIHISEPTRPY